MKRCFLVLLAVILCFTFTACDPSSYQFEYDELAAKVVRVELIEYNNPDQRKFASWVPDHMDDLLPFDRTKETVLETLEESNFPNLLRQLSRAEILYRYFAYDSPRGLCVKLTYASGDFLIVSCNSGQYSGYIGSFSKEGEVSEFYGCFSGYIYFETLVNNFFEMEI